MSARARAQNPAARSRTDDKHPRDTVPRKASEENQVMPFYEDDDDDGDEIQRRRHSSSSSASSSSASSDADRRCSNERRKPQSRSSRERENEWERASNHAASSSSDGDARDDSDADDGASSHSRSYAKQSGRKAREEPESPRKHHRKTQQQPDDSTSESHGDEDSGKVVTPTVTPVSAAPTAKLVALAFPTDLSRISKLAVFPGSEAQLVQGHVLRVKTLLHSHYHFFIKDQLVLMAEKQPQNRTSNYHIFDMTRTPALGGKLTKKSGNYLGKLRANFSKKRNVLFGNLSRKTELGAILFADHVSSSEPRHLSVVLPALAPQRQEIEGLAVGDDSKPFSLLLDMFERARAEPSGRAATRALQVFENKAPVFDNGFYRLNFHGRVSVPSVKNFQLVRAGSAPTGTLGGGQDDDVCLQFGKVDDRKFHLDFRAPLTPIQAFAIALAQFNL